MLKGNGFIDKELSAIIEERGRRILEKFGEVVVSQVKDAKLLAALEDVKSYWIDLSRSALTSFSCEAVGGNPEMAENAALMFTLASSAFGLHDDVLDRSSNKHLKMTILGLHGADRALLVGDLLFLKAWTVIHDMITQTCNPTKIADVVEVYGNLSMEMCEAEFMEIQCRRKVDTDVEYYKNILWMAMAETDACSKIGAMMGDGSVSEVEALSEFGRRIGFMSRLADDIEDCLNIKGDLLHRITYESVPLPLLYAAKSSTERFEKIEKIVQKNYLTPSDAKSLLKFCFESEAFEYVRSLGKKNEEKAAYLLQSLKPSNAQSILLLMTKRSYERIDNLCV